MSSNAQFIYITEIDLSIDNGPGVNERELVSALRKDYGSEVICVVPYPAHPEIHFDSGLEYVINHRSYHPIFYVVHLMSSFLRVLRLHRHYHFAGLIFRLGEIPIVPLVLSYFLKVPLILKTLAGYTAFSGEVGRMRKLLSNLLLPLYRATIRRALTADTVSIPYMDWLQFKFGIPKDQIILIHNGANTDFFSPGDQVSSRRKLGLDHFEHIIGYVGAMTSLRHLDMLISSLQMVKARGKVGLVLVGDGANRIALEALAKEQAVVEQVVFTGFIPYTMIPEYMRTFDVAVDLSLVSMKIGDKVLNASYSQKIPQYLSCGLPVIAWDTLDTQFLKHEQIGDVVPPGDVDSLTQAIRIHLTMNDLECTQLRLRAREYAKEHFSAKALAARRFAFWQSALATKHKDMR